MAPSSSFDRMQPWLVQYESMSRDQDDFHVGSTDLAIIMKRGLTLANCLTIAKLEDTPDKYTFHIYSQSMAAAVQLLSDESIQVLWELYCQQDPVVLIIVRPTGDPSPNVSRCPSHQKSFRIKTSLTRGRPVPEVEIVPQRRHIRGASDIVSGDKIEESDMVIIDLGDRKRVTLSKDYLLGWISSRLADLVNLTEIEVEGAMAVEGQEADTVIHTFKVTDNIWQQSLIRNAWGKHFKEIYNSYNAATVARNQALAECIKAQAEPGREFSTSCQMFIRDLRLFGSDKGARNRLDKVGHEFYLGGAYFKPEVVTKLLSIPTVSGTLETCLRTLQKKRADTGTDMCASHDLAPLYGAVFLVRWDKESKKATAMHRELPVAAQPSSGKAQKNEKGQMSGLRHRLSKIKLSKEDLRGTASKKSKN